MKSNPFDMSNRDRKKLDLATAKKSNRKKNPIKPIIEETQVKIVEETFKYETPNLSKEEDKVEQFVSGLDKEIIQESKTKVRPKINLSGKKKKTEVKPDFLDLDGDGDKTEPMVKSASEVEPKKKEVKEEVLETHSDRMLGVIDQQLSTMAKLNRNETPQPKNITEQKIENLEGQVRDMRRMVLEMSSVAQQNTIVGSLGAGSPGSGEVNYLKLDDVKGESFVKNQDGQLVLWSAEDQKFISSAERGVDNFFSEGIGGYEFTGGFSDREVGQTGASDFGTFVGYTQAMADAGQWRRFGFSELAQQANDNAYFPTDARPGRVFDQSKGLFGGIFMPSGVNELIDYGFSDASYNNEVNSGDPADFNYTAADGSFDFRECQPGDLLQLRFDFNVNVQIANTTLEIALIWQTRDENDNPTFSFALTGQPIFYGTGTVGRTFLNRPFLSAYFASAEDTNARALLAIRADNPIQVAPLSTLVTIQR